MTLFATPQNCTIRRAYAPQPLEFQYSADNVRMPYYLACWYNIYLERGEVAKMDDMKRYAELLDGAGRDTFYKRTIGKSI